MISLLKFFKPTYALPTAKGTRLSDHVSQEANKAVESVLKEQQVSEAPPVKKRKYTAKFSPEDHAKIGKYTAEIGNMAAARKYSIAESTGQLFKQKYLATLHDRVKTV